MTQSLPDAALSRWPGWRLAGLGVLAGLAMALGQAPFNLWPVALAGLCGLTLLVVRTSRARDAAWVGLFAGIGHFGLALSWIVEPFLIDPEVYGWMAPFAVVGMSAGLGLFWALAGWLAVRMLTTRAERALGFALTLTAVEFARGFVLTGFPWALVGHVWIGTPAAQMAALIGPNGLTLLATLAAALPVAGLRIGATVSVAMITAAFAYGTTRPDLPQDPGAPVLRLVQPNAEQHLKWDPDRAHFHFMRLLDLSEAVNPQMSPPDLVIWPETSVPYLLNRAGGAIFDIAAASGGAITVVGIQRTEGARGWNSMAVIAPDGQVGEVYDKHHLVPFGEYIPFGDLVYRWFGVRAFAAQVGNGYSAGAGAALLDLGPQFGLALPLICYEAVFPQDLRAAPGRARFILQITNDAWFGTLTGPFQHLAQARLRAIEQGLPLVRAANTGVSAVIDARGQVVAELPLGVSAFLDAALPAALPPTLYARWGEAPSLMLFFALALVVALLRRPRRP